MNVIRKNRAPLHKLPDLWRHDAKHFSDEAEAPVALGYADELEAALREQQPAGDGGRHVEVLRQLREEVPTINDWRESVEALDAAIAALTAAGRGGEGWQPMETCPDRVVLLCVPEHPGWPWAELPWPGTRRDGGFAVCTPLRNNGKNVLCELEAEPTGWRDLNLAAAPQQPPPVGVTDATWNELLLTAEWISEKDGGNWHDVGEEESAWARFRRAIEAAKNLRLSHQQPAPSVSEAPKTLREVVGDLREGVTIRTDAATMLGWRNGSATTPTAPEPAASGEGLSLADRIGFMVADGRHMGVNERTIDLDVLEEAARRLAGQADECGLEPLRRMLHEFVDKIPDGQGDVERLVEAASHYMEVRGSTHGQPARERLREALRPFQQQDTPEQEGSR